MKDTQDQKEGKFSYTLQEDSEHYHGAYDTRELAAQAAFAEDPTATKAWVGQLRRPAPPESFINGADTIEAIATQDDYCGEFADDWPSCTQEQEDDLTQAMQDAVKAWVERHKLEPWHLIVDDIEEVQRA